MPRSGEQRKREGGCHQPKPFDLPVSPKRQTQQSPKTEQEEGRPDQQMAGALEIRVELAGFGSRSEETKQSARDRSQNDLLSQGRHRHAQGKLAVTFRSECPRQQRHSRQASQSGGRLTQANPKELLRQALEANNRNPVCS